MDPQETLRRLNEMERLHRTGAIDGQDLAKNVRELIFDIEAEISEDG